MALGVGYRRTRGLWESGEALGEGKLPESENEAKCLFLRAGSLANSRVQTSRL